MPRLLLSNTLGITNPSSIMLRGQHTPKLGVRLHPAAPMWAGDLQGPSAPQAKGGIAGLLGGLLPKSSRPPRIHIERQPLTPGDRAMLRIVQPGPLELKDYVVLLICEEATDDGTTSRRRYLQFLLTTGPIRIAWGSPLDRVLTMDIPATAAPSSKTPGNEVDWKLVVRGELPDKHRVQHEFALDVGPLPGWSALGPA